MGDVETIELFMNRVQDLVNVIHSHGEQLDDRWIVEKVLRSLARKFYPLTIAIEEYRDLTQLSLLEFPGSLQTYEHKLQDRAYNLDQAFEHKLWMNEQLSTSFSSESTSRGHGIGCNGRGGHGRGRGRLASRSQSSDPIHYDLYGKDGHLE